MALNIVSPGPLTTVQDFGRHGHQAEGYPECGACDKYALALANLLCHIERRYGADAAAAALGDRIVSAQKRADGVELRY